MSFPYDDINTACREYIVPQMKNNVFQSNILAWDFLRKPKKWKGGTYFEVPILAAKNTNAEWYASGGQLTISHLAEFTKMRLAPSQANAAVTLYGIELEQNKYSGTKVFDLVKEKIKAAEMSLKDKFCQAMISGAGGTEIYGFTSIASVTNYGGVSDDDCATWKVSSFDGFASGADATAIVFDRAKLATTYMNCSVDADQPDRIYTTAAIWADIYGKIIEVNHRYTDEKLAQLGFQNVKYMNANIVWSSYIAADHLYVTNTKHLYFATFPGMNFKWIDFDRDRDYDAETGHVRWYGQLICDARWSFGMQSAITTVTSAA